MSEHEITKIIQRSRGVDEDGAEVIWNEYFPKLMRLARSKLGTTPRRTFDEEDVAVNALNSFFRGAEAERFSKLESRDDLWRILVTITARKVAFERRKQMAQKRGDGQVRGESIFVNRNSGEDFGLGQILDENRMPENASQVVSTCEELLVKLNDDNLRKTALLRMEGYNNTEISEKLGCSVSRTKQRVAKIKELWRDDLFEN